MLQSLQAWLESDRDPLQVSAKVFTSESTSSEYFYPKLRIHIECVSVSIGKAVKQSGHSTLGNRYRYETPSIFTSGKICTF